MRQRMEEEEEKSTEEKLGGRRRRGRGRREVRVVARCSVGRCPLRFRVKQRRLDGDMLPVGGWFGSMRLAIT